MERCYVGQQSCHNNVNNSEGIHYVECTLQYGRELCVPAKLSTVCRACSAHFMWQRGCYMCQHYNVNYSSTLFMWSPEWHCAQVIKLSSSRSCVLEKVWCINAILNTKVVNKQPSLFIVQYIFCKSHTDCLVGTSFESFNKERYFIDVATNSSIHERDWPHHLNRLLSY